MLYNNQKRNRMGTSMQCLAMFNCDPQDFFRRFMTVDETWIHHYTPETKQQSKQLTAASESAPNMVKTILFTDMVMTTIVWDFQGIIMIDYLEKVKTITSVYYTKLLHCLIKELLRKKTRLKRKKVFIIRTMHHRSRQKSKWKNYTN